MSFSSHNGQGASQPAILLRLPAKRPRGRPKGSLEKRKQDEANKKQKVSHSVQTIHPSTNQSNESILSALIDIWNAGPSALATGQRKKGEAILQALQQRPTTIPWLTVQNATSSATCVILDRVAPDTSAGPPPTLQLAFSDLTQENASVIFCDTVTNIVEEDAQAFDFWDQKARFSEQVPLDPGSRLLVAFEIPATRKGLLQCGWSCPKIDEAHRKTTSFSPLTTTWALPGTITHPHMDGVGSAAYRTHWKGTKLWILWPGTEPNLRKMEPRMTTLPTLETTLELIDTLDGLELLFLTDAAQVELSFYLLPNTIHCCLSFTECAHSGYYIQSTGFLPQVKAIMEWESKWIASRLLPNTTISNSSKEAVLSEFTTALKYWETLSKSGDLAPQIQNDVREILEISQTATKAYKKHTLRRSTSLGRQIDFQGINWATLNDPKHADDSNSTNDVGEGSSTAKNTDRVAMRSAGSIRVPPLSVKKRVSFKAT